MGWNQQAELARGPCNRIVNSDDSESWSLLHTTYAEVALQVTRALIRCEHYLGFEVGRGGSQHSNLVVEALPFTLTVEHLVAREGSCQEPDVVECHLAHRHFIAQRGSRQGERECCEHHSDEGTHGSRERIIGS